MMGYIFISWICVFIFVHLYITSNRKLAGRMCDYAQSEAPAFCLHTVLLVLGVHWLCGVSLVRVYEAIKTIGPPNCTVHEMFYFDFILYDLASCIVHCKISNLYKYARCAILRGLLDVFFDGCRAL